MNSHSIPFDLELANSISPESTKILCSFFNKDDINIINVKQFQEERGYEPCISSTFMVSSGGSYDYEMNGHEIVIHNGTLARISGYPRLRSFMNEYTQRVFH
jgi:hypothetical protein